MIVTVDFDDCLWTGGLNKTMATLIKLHQLAGDKVHILTARNKKHEHSDYRMADRFDILIKDFLDMYPDLGIVEAHFTNHELKGEFARRIGAEWHYDDKHEHLHDVAMLGMRSFVVEGRKVYEYDHTQPPKFCSDMRCIVCLGEYR